MGFTGSVTSARAGRVSSRTRHRLAALPGHSERASGDDGFAATDVLMDGFDHAFEPGRALCAHPPWHSALHRPGNITRRGSCLAGKIVLQEEPGLRDRVAVANPLLNLVQSALHGDVLRPDCLLPRRRFRWRDLVRADLALARQGRRLLPDCVSA